MLLAIQHSFLTESEALLGISFHRKNTKQLQWQPSGSLFSFFQICACDSALQEQRYLATTLSVTFIFQLLIETDLSYVWTSEGSKLEATALNPLGRYAKEYLCKYRLEATHLTETR